MGKAQTLVVGSGVGGLTMALLLARAGKNVTLVEKQREIGGYLRRFIRKGMYIRPCNPFYKTEQEFRHRYH